jgi:hypothetical protein
VLRYHNSSAIKHKNLYKTPRKKSVNWNSSDGKKLLIKDLCSGAIPIRGGDIAAIYNTRPQFGGDDANRFRLFAARLRNARKNVEDGQLRAASEAAALRHDRDLYPIRDVDDRNLPRWQGSQAQQLLKAYVSNGKHERMKPSALYITQDAYQIYSLDVFRGHIYQEQKLRKFLNQYGSRSNVEG